MRLTVVTAATPDYPCLDLVRQNREAYCEANGYALEFRVLAGPLERPASWEKVRLLRSLAVPGGPDWLLWVDADAVFTGPRPVHPVLALTPGAGLVAGTDVNWISCGVFFLANDDWGRRLLDRVWAQEQFTHHPWWEQAAVQYLVRTDPGVGRRTFLVHQRHFNSYPLAPYAYGDGDLVAHVCGAPRAVREAELPKYAWLG